MSNRGEPVRSQRERPATGRSPLTGGHDVHHHHRSREAAGHRGLIATALAASATTAIAAMGNFAGISLVVSGLPLPVAMSAVLTAVFSLVGLVLALVLARTARRPRTAFVRTTIVLTASSLVPDVLADAASPTKMLLMLAHLAAAAIVIPAIARRLSA